jgi:hypothetical protein
LTKAATQSWSVVVDTSIDDADLDTFALVARGVDLVNLDLGQDRESGEAGGLWGRGGTGLLLALASAGD